MNAEAAAFIVAIIIMLGTFAYARVIGNYTPAVVLVSTLTIVMFLYGLARGGLVVINGSHPHGRWIPWGAHSVFGHGWHDQRKPHGLTQYRY